MAGMAAISRIVLVLFAWFFVAPICALFYFLVADVALGALGVGGETLNVVLYVLCGVAGLATAFYLVYRLWSKAEHPKRPLDDDYQIVPTGEVRYSQLDITEGLNDNERLTADDWIPTVPLNLSHDDPNSIGLPSPSASEKLVYEIAAEMSSIRESMPCVDDGVYCPICHIANVDRSRLRTPCPRCGLALLSFGWN
jgi:hypothetical protein